LEIREEINMERQVLLRVLNLIIAPQISRYLRRSPIPLQIKFINSRTSCIVAPVPNIDGKAASFGFPSGDSDHIAEKDFL
jgi:hypothetical protein